MKEDRGVVGVREDRKQNDAKELSAVATPDGNSQKKWSHVIVTVHRLSNYFAQ